MEKPVASSLVALLIEPLRTLLRPLPPSQNNQKILVRIAVFLMYYQWFCTPVCVFVPICPVVGLRLMVTLSCTGVGHNWCYQYYEMYTKKLNQIMHNRRSLHGQSLLSAQSHDKTKDALSKVHFKELDPTLRECRI